MTVPTTSNEKPAPDSNRDGLEFVWTTPLPPRKDSNNDLLQQSLAAFKPY